MVSAIRQTVRAMGKARPQPRVPPERERAVKPHLTSRSRQLSALRSVRSFARITITASCHPEEQSDEGSAFRHLASQLFFSKNPANENCQNFTSANHRMNSEFSQDFHNCPKSFRSAIYAAYIAKFREKPLFMRVPAHVRKMNLHNFRAGLLWNLANTLKRSEFLTHDFALTYFAPGVCSHSFFDSSEVFPVGG